MGRLYSYFRKVLILALTISKFFVCLRVGTVANGGTLTQFAKGAFVHGLQVTPGINKLKSVKITSWLTALLCQLV